MGKRKRNVLEEDEYLDFCNGLQKTSTEEKRDTSYIYSVSRAYKRPRINPNLTKPGEVSYQYLDSTDEMYQEIEKLITNRFIKIDDIVEVKNSALEEAYYKKREQKIGEYGEVEEAFLFHGTKVTKVPSICRYNFDWRLTGSNKGHKFGQGVCFSRNAKYASNYSDRDEHFKVMIVAKVLIAKVCRGHHDMSIPPKGYDTSQKGDNGVVLVKYEDNEFYPAYIMYYHFSPKKAAQSHRYQEHHSDRYGNNWDSRYDSYHNNYYYNSHNYNYRDNYSHQTHQDYHYDSYHHSYQSHEAYHKDSPDFNRKHKNFFNSHDYSDNNTPLLDYSLDGHYSGSKHYYSFLD